MESEEKFQSPSPIPFITNSEDLNQKGNTIKAHTEKIQQKVFSIIKTEKIEMINKIFLSNCSFNKKTNEFLISLLQIILILKKSNIINDEIISKAQADVILIKIKPNHNKYKFIDFMNFLTEIFKYIF